ncbi:helix-turn-helix domain-containing protein [Chryseobacterium polytrichastri]|uniref:Helix-turn-helix domain-containing protein n=1 Tax=Chryseobacterium polytrichastri TaxID=1302687 RepID=A0A1M6YXN7_9FLAO|nr:AraC family transcriptional regulator [Chryseobacterium polytrichastri]SHL23084.1 Helix-turn-helix domain-containing protein [Chryseobacterium polytrichastri]
MTQKIIKFPLQLTDSESTKRNSLVLDGYSVIEKCIQNTEEKGMLYLEESVLLLVLEGSASLTFGKQTYTVAKNQLTLLKKARVYEYEKKGNSNNKNIYHELLIVLKDDLIKSFLTTTEKIIPKETNGEIGNGVHSMTECLIIFTESIDPYFNDKPEMYSGQLRLKLKEMLYHLGIGNQSLFQELTQLREPVKTEIQDVMEQNFFSPITLTDFAYISGRSLSSFKRDFQNIYNMPPATWIRKKRLEKAKEILETTQLPISEICFSLGFENVSHFSRIFKEYHGNTPNFYRAK